MVVCGVNLICGSRSSRARSSSRPQRHPHPHGGVGHVAQDAPGGQVGLERVRGGHLVHDDGALGALDRQLHRLPRVLGQILEERMGGAHEAHVRQAQVGPGDHGRAQVIALGLGVEDHEALPLERAQHAVGGGLGDAGALRRCR